jgi:tetratricopeptide (TPR) repeat protein
MLFYLAATVGQGATPASDLLTQAWHEYRLQSWGQAESLFYQVMKHPDSDKQNVLDAEMGLAMITQFNTRKPNPSMAATKYETLLKKVSAGERALLLKSLYADCLWQSGQTSKADTIWSALFEENLDSLVVQDALLQRTLMHMKGERDPETAKAIAYLDTTLTKLPPLSVTSPGLAPVFLGLIGDFYLHNNQPGKARDYYKRQIELTTPDTGGYSLYAGRLFQIARLSEVDLHDLSTAGQYYRRLIHETPNDSRFFFALEKAASLGAISAAEIQALHLQGLTDEIINGLFEANVP